MDLIPSQFFEEGPGHLVSVLPSTSATFCSEELACPSVWGEAEPPEEAPGDGLSRLRFHRPFLCWGSSRGVWAEPPALAPGSGRSLHQGPTTYWPQDPGQFP